MTVYCKEKKPIRKLVFLCDKLISLLALVLAISSPTILFLLTGIGWVSLLGLFAVVLLFNKLSVLLLKFTSDETILPRCNNLSSIECHNFLR